MLPSLPHSEGGYETIFCVSCSLGSLGEGSQTQILRPGVPAICRTSHSPSIRGAGGP
jgi:hypothetical protein